MVPETWSTTDNFLTFYPHPPNNVENQKLEKMPGDNHHFTLVFQNSRSYAILFLRYGA